MVRSEFKKVPLMYKGFSTTLLKVVKMPISLRVQVSILLLYTERKGKSS